MKRYNLFISSSGISVQKFLQVDIKQLCNLRVYCFLFVVNFFSLSLLAEGTPQMQPESTDGIAPLYINANIDEGGERTNFAGWDNDDEFSRLYINIQDPSNECIYLGLGAFNSVYNDNGIKYRIIAPDGEVLIEQLMSTNNIVGVDNDAKWDNAAQGPFEVTGAGYIAGIHAIHPTDFANMSNANQVGDYYIEFTEVDDEGNPIGGEIGDDGFWVNQFDITVAKNCTSTPVRVNGRVWSYRWEFRTNNGSFEGAFYVCADDEASPATNDGFITLIDFKDADFAPFYFNLIFNREGPGIGQSIGDKRKSRIDCDPIGIPEYKAFLNDPDEAICASASFGSPTSPLTLEQCGPTDFCWTVRVDKFGGEFEIFLDLNGEIGYQMGTSDVLLSHKIEQGQENTYICIPWNGETGEGLFLGLDIEPANVKASYIEGIFHFPVFDAERSNTGFMVEYVRPLPEGCPGDDCPPILIRWDDSEVNGGDCDDSCGTPYQPCPKSIGNGCADVQLIGCDPNDADCKRCWQSSYGDRATLNTFWNVLIQPLEFESAGENYLEVEIEGMTSLCRIEDTSILSAALNPIGISDLTGWKWSGPAGEISAGNSLPIDDIGPLGINDLGEYRLTINFGLACVVNTSTELIKVDPPSSPVVVDPIRKICEGESSLISFNESVLPNIHFFYDEDPATNPGVSPVASGDSYDPLTSLGEVESVWVSYFDGTCESDATEVYIDNNCIADLAITKDDGSLTYIPGTTISYSIIVRNNGPLDVVQAMIEDTAPAGTEISVWSAIFSGNASGNSSGNGNISEFVDLPNGGTITYTVNLSIPSSFIGSLSNTASVMAPAGIIETNPGNNSATDTNSNDARADLAIEKTDNVSSVIAGDGNTYTYIISVSNDGPSDANNVIVSEDALPTGFMMATVSSSQGDCDGFPCNLGTLTNGSNASISVEYTVPSNTQNSAQSNTVSVSSDELDLNQSNNQATDNTEVLTSADLEILKTDNETAVIAGDGNVYTYEITVSNNGPSHADNVVVTEDSFPAGFIMGNVSSTQGNCGSVPCNLGSLSDGASASIYIEYTVPASTQPSVQSNTVSVSSDDPDPENNNNSATDYTTVSSEVNLAISKTDNQESVIAGDGNTYSYEIRVDNTGPSDANNVIVTEDSFPAGFVMGNVSSSQSDCTGFPCNLGTISSGSNASITIEYSVPSNTQNSVQTNSVSVSSDELDLIQSNNIASDDTQVLTSADLAILKTDNETAVIAGDENVYTYEITVTNNGPSHADNVVVTEDSFPAGFIMGNVSSTQGNCGSFPCNLGSLSDGASASIFIQYTVPSSTQPSIQSNTVSVSSDDPDPESNNNSATDNTTVSSEVNLVISKTDNQESVIAGDGNTYSYEIRVDNTGPSDANNVVVTEDSFPAGFVMGNVSSSQSDCDDFPCNLGTISSGSSASITIEYTIPSNTQSSIQTNTVSVSSDELDLIQSDNIASDDTEVLTSADLEIFKTDNETAVIAGDGIVYTYEITVTNNGPSHADNVVVTEDSFPADFVMGTVNSTQGNCGSFPCNLGSLSDGASASIYIQYTVPSSTQPSIQSNTVSVSSDDPDPENNNNSAADNTTVSSEANLAISKTDNQESVIAGDGNTYTYDIQVDNIGPSDANNVIVTEDSFPAGFVMGNVSSTQGDCNGFPCNLGTIEATANASISIEYTVPSSTLPSVKINRVSVSSDEVDIDNSDNSASDETEVLAYSNLGLGISDNREKVTAGDGNTYTYFIRVDNNGPSDAKNVTVTEEEFPSGFTMKTVTSSQNNCQGFPCNLGTVPQGSNAVILVNYTVPPSTPTSMQTNTVSVISDEPDFFRGQNTASDQTLVITESDLSITKTDGAINYTPGSLVTYTIEVSNGGMSDAFDAQVTDTAPVGTSIESWTADFIGGALGNTMGNGDINETVYIPVGDMISYTVNVVVPDDFMNVLENTATVEVSPSSTDPDLNNNSATDSNDCLPSASCLLDGSLITLNACELPDPETDPNQVFDIVACQGILTMISEDIGDTDLCDLEAEFQRIYTLYIDGLPFGSCSQNFLINCMPESEMACRSHVQISLDESCHAEITPDMILQSEVNCVDRFLVELFYQGELIENSPWVDNTWVGYSLDVVLTDLIFGNTCTSIIHIEDKLPPVFTDCDETVMIACYDELNYLPEVIDNCDGPVIPQLIGETKKLNNCQPGTDETILQTITRIYQATDSQGNVSLPCTVNIQIKRVIVGEVIFPSNWDLAGNSAIKCDETLVTTIIEGKEVLDPAYYGGPTWNGVDLWLNQGAACNLHVSFEDFELPTINCVSKIMRIWWVREWFCSAENLVNNTAMPQIIEIVDDQGPVFDCPANETYSTNGFSCELQIYIPKPEANDVCGEVVQIDMEYPGGFESNWQGGYVTLYNGMNNITFYGYDNCENSSTCAYTISIEDHTAPVAICEEFTVVSVGLDGEAYVHAQSFNNGSYDDCEIKTMLARRMDDGCPDCEVPDYEDFNYLGEYAGHHYYLSHYKFRGDKSFKMAEAMGGYAVSFNSSEEEVWVNGKVREINSEDNYYIGLSDGEEEGLFTWQDGSELGYSNWFDGFPNNWGDNDFVVVDNSFDDQWQVVNSFDSYAFVLEIDNPCNWSRYERFCCDDIGTDVMVGFRAIDRWGNYNDCMVTVEVQDKLAPQISCPPDLTIACEYDYATLDVFGVVRDSEAGVQPIAIPEEYIINSSGPLYDGFSYDNCDVTVSVSSTPDFNQCGIGIIERTFTAEDAGGLTISCTQRIKVQSESPFDGLNPLDLIWPDDIEEFGCENPEDYPPEVTGKPTFPGDDECDLVAVTYEDEVYNFNNSIEDACFKIIRNWSVIDWCQFGNGENYIWTDLQIIKINNSNAPDFTSSCDFVSTCTYDATCEDGYIELKMTAMDDCTADEDLRWEYKIDRFNDGFFDDIGSTNDASAHYPIGQHLIKWTVEDKCGNKVSCEQNFLIENCKAPTSYCLRGVAVDLMPQDTDEDGLPDTGMIVIWADDLDAGSSHSCENVDVTLSFSPDPSDTYREFTCSDVGEHDIDLYAISETSTGLVWSFCTASIDIQDNTGVCGIGDGMAQISGRIFTEEAQSLSQVSVDLEGSELDPLETNNSGEYLFENMPQGGSYSIIPSRNFDPLNGISTMDLVLMQRHIIGYELLDSPYKMIAADVNNDKKITSRDMLELRKMILDVQEGFSNNESWRFLVADHEFEDPSHPLANSFPEEYAIDLLVSDEEVDFMAMKTGDVSGDASGYMDIANVQTSLINTRSNNPIELFIQDRTVLKGETIEITLRSATDLTLFGYQFSLDLGELAASIEDIEAGVIDVTNRNFGTRRIGEGIITTSWNQNTAKNISEGSVLFTIHVLASKSGRLSDMIKLQSNPTRAEAYPGIGAVQPISLHFRMDFEDHRDLIELYQNTPNPFTESSTIRFYLPMAQEASMHIFDVNGKMLKSVRQNYSEGIHELLIDQSELGGNGVYYYRLQAGDFSSTKKLVLLK